MLVAEIDRPGHPAHPPGTAGEAKTEQTTLLRVILPLKKEGEAGEAEVIGGTLRGCTQHEVSRSVRQTEAVRWTGSAGDPVALGLLGFGGHPRRSWPVDLARHLKRREEGHGDAMVLAERRVLRPSSDDEKETRR